MDVITYTQDLWKKLTGKTDENPDYSDVIARIDELNKQNALPSRPTLDEPTPYQRLEYAAPTDEEIEKRATDALEPYKAAKESSIEKEIAALIGKYEGAKAENAASYESTIKALRSAYDTAVSEAADDALKRGLARSSIASGVKAALSEKKTEGENEAKSELEKKNAEIEQKLSSLEAEKQRAMDEFNITYTAKLIDSINKLKRERADNEAAVIKYNNSLAEKEFDDKLAKEKAESSLYSQALSQYEKERELINEPDAEAQDRLYAGIYDVFREKLSTMSAAKAREEVRTNPIFSRYLSTAYYYKLYNEFGRDRD